MATSTLKADMTMTPEVITLSDSSMTFDSPLSLYGNNRIFKIGKICILSVRIKVDSATQFKNLKIANYFPSSCKPMLDISASTGTGLGDGKEQGIFLKADGTLSLWPVNLNTATYAIGAVAYICQ